MNGRTLSGTCEAEQLYGTLRMIGVDDLPVARTEIELSTIDPELVLELGSPTPSKVMVLVTLHTHPLGVVFLDGALGRSLRTHATSIWALLGEEINAHLAADGLPLAAGLADVAKASRSEPRCVTRRAGMLARPPLISVVIATRDRPEGLRSCVNALLQMEYTNFELLIVDNDPTTDATAAVAAEFGPQVRYVREDRRGLAAAHNCGLSAAHGQIIAFVDDDVIVDRHWLTAIAEGFSEADDVGCVTGLILPAELETQAQLLRELHGGYDKGFQLRIFDTDENRPEDPLFPFTAGKLGSGANMAFDTEILRGLGGFDPALGIGTYARGGDDLASFFRVVVAGHRLVYQPSAVVWHQHPRELAALRNQAQGYGVGLGTFLTSCLVKEPRMIGALLRRIPAGFAYAFNPSSVRNHGQYEGWPAEFARIENRGLISGPAAYAVSRWRSRRAVNGVTAQHPRRPQPTHAAASAGGSATERQSG